MVEIIGSPLPGIDEAWDQADISAIINAGAKFVCRDYSYDHTGKNLTGPEAAKFAAAGLWIVSVWEYAPHAPLTGATQGTNDGMAAAIQAGLCGQPRGSVIYFAVDFDAGAAQYPTIAAYLAAARRVLRTEGYEAGVYAGYDVVRYMLNTGIVEWAWQTYAWSRGKWDQRAQIRQTVNGIQLAGHNVDDDQAEFAWYGQWQPDRLPSEKGNAGVELTDEVPGTGIPGHEGNKLLQDILMDLASLREMLVTGVLKPPIDSPLTGLLGMAARQTAMNATMGKLADAMNNMLNILTGLTEGPSGVNGNAAVVEQLRRIADALTAAPTPPALPTPPAPTPVEAAS